MALPYEEARRINIEENKKRMNALKLPYLSQSFYKSPAATCNKKKKSSATTSKRSSVSNNLSIYLLFLVCCFYYIGLVIANVAFN
jgi:hypothetical protein